MRLVANPALLLLALLLAPVAHSLGVVTHLPMAGVMGGYRPVILVYAGTSRVQAFHVTIKPVLHVSCTRGSLRAPPLPPLDIYIPVTRLVLPIPTSLPIPPGVETYLAIMPGLPTLQARVENRSLECNVSLVYRVVVEPYPSSLVLSDTFTVEGGSEKLPPLLLAYTSAVDGYTLPAGKKAVIHVVVLSVAADPKPLLVAKSPSGSSILQPEWDPSYRAIVESLRSWWRSISEKLRELGVNPPRFHTTIYVGAARVGGAAGEYIFYYAEWRGARSNPGILYVYNPDAPERVLVVDEGVLDYLLLLSHEWLASTENKSVAEYLAKWLGLNPLLLKRFGGVEEALLALNSTGLVTRPSWEKIGVYAVLRIVEPGLAACRALQSYKPDVVILGFNLASFKPLSEIRCPDGSTLIDKILGLAEKGKTHLIISMGSFNGYEIGVCNAESGTISWLEYNTGLLSYASRLGLHVLDLAERVKRELASRLCMEAKAYLEEGRITEAKRLERLSTLVASSPLLLYTVYNGKLLVDGLGAVSTTPYTLIGWEFERAAPLNVTEPAVENASTISRAILEAYMLVKGEHAPRYLLELAGEGAAYSLTRLIPRLIEALSKADVREAAGVILLHLFNETIRLTLDKLPVALASSSIRLLGVSVDKRAALLCITSPSHKLILSTVMLSSLRGVGAWRLLLSVNTCKAHYQSLYGAVLLADAGEGLADVIAFYTSNGYRLEYLHPFILPIASTLVYKARPGELILVVHPGSRLGVEVKGNATIISRSRGYELIGVLGASTLRLYCVDCVRLLNPIYILAYRRVPLKTVTVTSLETITETSTVTRLVERIVTRTVYRVLTPPTKIVTVTVTRPPLTVTRTATNYAEKTVTVTTTRIVERAAGIPVAIGVIAGFTTGFIVAWLAARRS